MAYINKEVSTMAMPSGMNRMGQFPLDMSSVWYSMEELTAYATSGAIAYVGQIVSLVDEVNNKVVVYSIQNKAGDLKEVGVIPLSGDAISVDENGRISVNVDNSTIKIVDNKLTAIIPEVEIPEYEGDNKSIEISELKVSMHDFGKAFYKYIPEVKDEEGNITTEARYDRVEVSETNVWKAGLEPKVVAENGELVIGWFEPNPTTIEGVNNQVTAVQGTVADLELSVGTPSAEGQEATGLYKEVEDVQEEVNALTDVVGSAEDSLSEDVQTVWANINDQAARLEALEEFDHSVYATKEELSAEADRADKAEKANAQAIKAIADDYLKAEHIANMATDAEVEAAVKAEADRAKGIEEGLQNQINLIMNNPDTENVINSISEFVTYIEEHGEIAEGFRTDIDKNKEDIAAEAEAARAAEGALSGRLDVLEAIDHDAYIAADTALKSELNAEIEKKADAEQVASDIAAAKQAAIDDAASKAATAKSEAIADADAKLALKANAADVYAKSEVYTKGEADELLNAKANAADVEKDYAKKATTLAGYGITDAYTATQTDEAIRAKIAEMTGGESAADVLGLLNDYKASNDREVWGDEFVNNHTVEGKYAPTYSGNSRIDDALARIQTLESVGAQANVIEEVKGAESNRLSVATEGKVVTIDDANLRADIAAAKKAGEDAGAAALSAAGTAQAAAESAQNAAEVADGKAVKNAEDIKALQEADTSANGRLQALESTVNNEVSGVAANYAAVVKNAGDITTLNATVGTHTTDIADLKTATANNGTAITNLQSAVANVYTKTEADAKYATIADMGVPTAGKTIVQMIADAQAAATYNDTQVKADIQKNADAIVDITKEGGAIAVAVAAEAAIARAAEKKNADDIAEINALLNTVDSEDAITSLKELATWVEEHGNEAAEMSKTISANAEAIEAINDANDGILAKAKAHSDANLATAKEHAESAAAAVEAKIPGVDDKTIKLAENKAYVAEVSTDILVQGNLELVLCGGNASGFGSIS